MTKSSDSTKKPGKLWRPFVIAIVFGVAITMIFLAAGAFDSSPVGAPRSDGPGAPRSRV